MIINERNHIASKLVVGIKDKTGKTNALSYSEVQETKIANKQNCQVGKSFTTKATETHLTSSLRHPKILIKEFSYFLMPCHQHGLRINLLV